MVQLFPLRNLFADIKLLSHGKLATVEPQFLDPLMALVELGDGPHSHHLGLIYLVNME